MTKNVPYDIDHNKEPQKPYEVEIIQYLRPYGKRRRMFAPVGEEYVEKAEDMVLSCEELTTGEVAIYVRFADELVSAETMKLADNGPGKNEPTKVLQRLIDKKWSERYGNKDGGA